MRGGEWLIYALGGGWGHLTRAAALVQAARGRHRVRILTNSPYASRVALAVPEFEIAAVGSREEAAALVRGSDPECLIVDTLPRGLGGELADVLGEMTCPRVLIHRDLNPEYVGEFHLKAFVEKYYELVIIPGREEGDSFAGEVTTPWIFESRASVEREPLGVLVCAGGNADELPWYAAVMDRLARMQVKAHCVAAEIGNQHWPASDLFPGCDAVVGGAGYNTTYECLAHGIPLIAKPWPRLYDRQERRARKAAQYGWVTIVDSPEEAADLAATVRKSGKPGISCNGAREAVALIEHSLS